MTKAIPSISKYMTTTPHTVGQEQTIARAAKLMREHHIRHLPVLHGGLVVGILSDRDVALVEALKDVDPQLITVGDAMTPDPYTTTPNATLAEVAKAMAEHKYGAAIVLDAQKVVGVFTTTDACRVLAELIAT